MGVAFGTVSAAATVLGVCVNDVVNVIDAEAFRTHRQEAWAMILVAYSA